MKMNMSLSTKFSIIGLALVFGLAGCVGRSPQPTPQSTPSATASPLATPSAAAAQRELYVVYQPPGESCTDATPELDFQDPRYANAEFICSINDQYNLILHTKPNSKNDRSAPYNLYLVDGYLEEKTSKKRLQLWQDDIYLYPPNPMVSYDHQVNDNILEIKTLRVDSGGYFREQWYVDLRQPKFLLEYTFTNFGEANDYKIYYRKGLNKHTIALRGRLDSEFGIYYLEAITHDGNVERTFNSLPIKLNIACELCTPAPEFSAISVDKTYQTISFDLSVNDKKYGHYDVRMKE